MSKTYITHPLLRTALLAFIIGNLSIGVFAAAEGATEYERQNLLRDFLRRGVESTSLHVSFFSYRPGLAQFTELLNSLGAPKLDAGLMPTASLILKHTPELSSRIEIGYWTNDTAIPPPTAAELSATFIPASLSLLYRPVLIHDFLPLYLGGGVGYSHLSVDGSALNLLEAQGITVNEGNSGLTGYALIGLEFLFLEDQLTLTLEAKRILKTFTTGGTPPLDLEFDGTAIGMGVGLRF
ncbi:MAG: hypothetical protein O7E52_13755 [Candidatus Poribacteria bacterium]|nr:hypothetical protein [Candidatus Poribacteria bacterium]